jgi:hypothetical protein
MAQHEILSCVPFFTDNTTADLLVRAPDARKRVRRIPLLPVPVETSTFQSELVYRLKELGSGSWRKSKKVQQLIEGIGRAAGGICPLSQYRRNKQ